MPQRLGCGQSAGYVECEDHEVCVQKRMRACTEADGWANGEDGVAAAPDAPAATRSAKGFEAVYGTEGVCKAAPGAAAAPLRSSQPHGEGSGSGNSAVASQAAPAAGKKRRRGAHPAAAPAAKRAAVQGPAQVSKPSAAPVANRAAASDHISITKVCHDSATPRPCKV